MKLYSASEACRIPLPPWVMPGWVRERTLTMISAPGGVGKSNFVTAMCLAAATGQPFLGQGKPERRARVVYLAIDAAPWDHAHVTRRILAGMGLEPEAADPSDEWGGGFFFCFEPLLLEDGRFAEVINAAAYGTGAAPDIMVVDSLSNIHDKDENKAQEMMPVMRFFRRYAEQNCAVIFLHHTKKPSESASSTGWDAARGSGVMHNSVDTHLILKPRSNRRNTLAGKRIETVWAKGRGGDEVPIVKYRCVWSPESMRFEPIRRGRPARPKEVRSGNGNS